MAVYSGSGKRNSRINQPSMGHWVVRCKQEGLISKERIPSRSRQTTGLWGESKLFEAELAANVKNVDFSCRRFKTLENVQKFTFAECREEAVNKIKDTGVTWRLGRKKILRRFWGKAFCFMSAREKLPFAHNNRKGTEIFILMGRYFFSGNSEKQI